MIPSDQSDRAVVVGIATRNRVDVLRKSIQSALQQSYRPLRVAVIDDASTDQTAYVGDEFTTVSWTRWQYGQGYIRARNHMMMTATDDYYVSLDDDAWFVQGDEIAIAVDFLERWPKVAAVAFDILSPDCPHMVPRGKAVSVAMFVGCGHVLRLSAVKEMGGYVESPGLYGGEEKDLCIRLIDAGYQIVKFDGVHVWHDKSSLARDLADQHRSGVCNDLAFVLRRTPLGLIIPSLIWKISKHLVFSLRAGLLISCLKGFVKFGASANRVWCTRHPVRLSTLSRFRVLSKVVG